MDVKQEPGWCEDSSSKSCSKSDCYDMETIKMEPDITSFIISKSEEEAVSSELDIDGGKNVKEELHLPSVDMSRMPLEKQHIFVMRDPDMGKGTAEIEDSKVIASSKCNLNHLPVLQEVIWRCYFCKKTFRTEPLLREHYVLHKTSVPCLTDTEENSCSCDGMDNGFICQHSLKSQGKKYHPNISFKGKCGTLSKKYDEIVSGSLLKICACDICGKEFPFKSNLKTHILSHTGERPFSCTICDKAFCQPSDVRRHMLTHSKEKPHSCTICGREFALSSNLKIHLMTHTGDKPHKCIICEKTFYRLKHLHNHICRPKMNYLSVALQEKVYLKSNNFDLLIFRR